jgi:hypothetical protein
MNSDVLRARTEAEAALRDRAEAVIRREPPFATKRRLAEVIEEVTGAPISYRTIETRPLPWRIHNGKALTPTGPAIRGEVERVLASPEYRVTGAKAPAAT